MSRLSLRWRLTLFYGGVLAVVLGLVGVAVFFALRSSVHQTLDDSLREAASVAATQLVGDELPQSDPKSELVEAKLPGRTVLLVYDKSGRLTDRIGLPRVSAPLEPGFRSMGNVRAFTQRLPDGGWVQAMRSDIETLGVLRRVQQLLLLGLPLSLLAGLAGGYLVADRALRPVDAVSRMASSIAASGQYRTRVPEASGSDEMARLTQTVNAMLGKLEATIERERAFALAAAHELRTPLALLRGQASLSLRRERSPEEYRQGFRTVEETSLEMTQLVESLLALARTNQPPQVLPTNLEDLAVEALESLSVAARARSVRVELETLSAPVQGDPAALRLVVTNLLGNAIQYGREGGRVWVRTLRRDHQAVLEVADDGPGVPEPELERLTQPFQRGLGLQGVGGTGLGLALVTAVVEQHGGRLALGRAPEGGLRATVILPNAR